MADTSLKIYDQLHTMHMAVVPWDCSDGPRSICGSQAVNMQQRDGLCPRDV